MSPFSQLVRRLSRCWECVLAFEFLYSFWSVRMGSTIAALRATDSIVEHSAKALNDLAISRTNCFPAFPKGTKNRFGLQCTTSLYTDVIIDPKAWPSWGPQVNSGSATGSYQVIFFRLRLSVTDILILGFSRLVIWLGMTLVAHVGVMLIYIDKVTF